MKSGMESGSRESAGVHIRRSNLIMNGRSTIVQQSEVPGPPAA